MELSFLTKLRITAAIAAGVLIIGIFAWPLVRMPTPFDVISLAADSITFPNAIVLVGLAFLTGLVGFFVSWPYGGNIGVLAVPSGLAIWAVRSGSITELMRQNSTVAAHKELFAVLKWEPFYWLALVGAGLLAVILAQKITQKKSGSDLTSEKSDTKTGIYLSAGIALVASVLLARLCLSIFAQDIRVPDDKLGSVIIQLTTGQIGFAVLFSFGIAAFVVKKFLDGNYIWPIIASALMHPLLIIVYLKSDVLERLTRYWPAAFFPNPVASILPLQMVAFGTLGSIAGYWLAVRYSDWRQRED